MNVVPGKPHWHAPAGAIDTHAHVVSKDIPIQSTRHKQPDHDVRVEDFIALLDGNGMAGGVLTAPSFYGTDNSLLLAALDAYPDRLRGTVIVDPDVDHGALEAMSARGATGIRLNWIRRPDLPDFTTPAYARLFAAVRALDWHVEVFLEGERLPPLLAILRKAGVKVCLDHFACPDPSRQLACEGFRMALDAVRAGNCWIKLSAPYRLSGVDPRIYVDAILAAGGEERLVWASDWPWVSYENQFNYQDCLDWAADWISDQALREKILVTTPRALFRFGD